VGDADRSDNAAQTDQRRQDSIRRTSGALTETLPPVASTTSARTGRIESRRLVRQLVRLSQRSCRNALSFVDWLPVSNRVCAVAFLGPSRSDAFVHKSSFGGIRLPYAGVTVSRGRGAPPSPTADSERGGPCVRSAKHHQRGEASRRTPVPRALAIDPARSKRRKADASEAKSRARQAFRSPAKHQARICDACHASCP
jgi:hypothetical protein